MTMFFYGLTGFTSLRTPPEGAVKVKVIARMWSWSFEYENGAKAEILRVPIDKPVLLLLTSQDVIHSFYIPAFKINRMPSRGWRLTCGLNPPKRELTMSCVLNTVGCSTPIC